MEAMTSPCSACPWRKSNQGKSHPHGWYSKANLRRLWAGLRTGEAPGMTCHPTDKENPIPDGTKPVPDNVERHECAGAILLVIRELRLIEKDPALYIKILSRTRIGLTKDGIAWWGIARCSLANTPLGGPSFPVIEEDPDIARPGVEEAVHVR